MCLFVFPHDISKTDAAKNTKLGVKGSKVKVTSYKNIAGFISSDITTIRKLNRNRQKFRAFVYADKSR